MSNLQKMVIIGFALMIAFGLYSVIFSYYPAVSPLEESRGLLDRIQTTADTQAIIEHIRTIKALLPKEGNPVWIFPTDSTDFGLIQSDLDAMIADMDKASTAPWDSTDFHSNMINVHEHAYSIRNAILDATPYVYTNLSFVIATLIWMIGVMGLTEVLRQKFK
ncbi:MAG: hypothetical protein ACRD9Q_00665 [Nitrososphaeraceae archaeon]